MDANQTPARGRRAKDLLGALVLAGSLIGGVGVAAPASLGAHHSAADRAASAAAVASADVTNFATDSAAMGQAETIAVKHWGAVPCGGSVSVSWAVLDPTVNASSDWWNPVAAYGNAPANAQCKITLNEVQAFDWPMFCTVMVHEIGHLVGQQHTTDKTSVMYPIYTAPIPECTGAPAGSPAPVPVAGRATASATNAKAHSRHKKAHTHKAKRKAKKKA